MRSFAIHLGISQFLAVCSLNQALGRVIVDKSIQEKFIYAIDDKIKEAGDIMDLADLTDDEADNPDVYDTVYEERFHCGKCVVRTVMETVWPSVDEYMDYLEGTVRGSETLTRDAHTALKKVFASITINGGLQSMSNEDRELVISTLALLNTVPEPISIDTTDK